MKLFKEIRRRARNAAQALRGKEVSTPLTRMHVNIEPVKVETFCIERSLPRSAAIYTGEERIRARYCESVARDLGEDLLRSGCIKLEFINPPGLAGYDVGVVRARVRVVRPEKEGAAV